MTTTSAPTPNPVLHKHVVNVEFEYTIAEAGSPIVCPICGGEPVGCEQTFVAPCRVFENDDEDDSGRCSYGYLETDTNYLWDSSEEVTIEGLPLILCEGQHYFIHPDFEVS